MRLADFILADAEAILAEWESFARGVWPDGVNADPPALRDHAEEILRATARDMMSAQTADERAAKSKGAGRGGESSARLNGASDVHAAGRVQSGFDLLLVVAEYRALRASVIRLWRAARPHPDQHDLDDLVRFDESIDQSLTKSVASFTRRIDQSRQMFLAILGHDLRTPLAAMSMSSAVLSRGGQVDAAEVAHWASQVSTSTAAMSRMITDLLDFTAAGLGGGMPLAPARTNLDALCREVVDETRAAHPQCMLRYDAHGDLAGEWDAARLRQVVSNLLGNAVQHGGGPCEIDVTVRPDGPGVRLDVRNGGDPIPPDSLATIFDPLVRLTSPAMQTRRRPGSIGLGLYIAREIVAAHGGTINVTSSAGSGTTFTVRLPRRPPA